MVKNFRLCDCRLRALKEWLVSANVPQIVEPSCAAPARLVLNRPFIRKQSGKLGIRIIQKNLTLFFLDLKINSLPNLMSTNLLVLQTSQQLLDSSRPILVRVFFFTFYQETSVNFASPWNFFSQNFENYNLSQMENRKKWKFCRRFRISAFHICIFFHVTASFPKGISRQTSKINCQVLLLCEIEIPAIILLSINTKKLICMCSSDF